MRVIRAEVLGMCFGVRDALAVIDRIGDPRECDDSWSARAQRGRP